MAVDRSTPTVGPSTGSAFATAVNEEIGGLWDRAVAPPGAGGGTHTITPTPRPTPPPHAAGPADLLIPANNHTAPPRKPAAPRLCGGPVVLADPGEQHHGRRHPQHRFQGCEEHLQLLGRCLVGGRAAGEPPLRALLRRDPVPADR